MGNLHVMTLLAAVVAAGHAVALQQPQVPYVPRQSDRPAPVDGDEPGFQADLRRQDPGRVGRGSEVLARRGRRAGRRNHPGDRRQEQHVRHLAGWPSERLRAEAGLSHHGGWQQRHQLPQRQRAGCGHADNKFALRGYQFDIDGGRRYVGNNYEEKGRLFVGLRGQVTRIVGGRPPVALSTIGDATEMAGVATDGWNAVHLVVRGNTLMHFLNGRLMSVTIDDDVAEPAGRRAARHAGARRSADESRVPEHPAEELVGGR